MNSIRLIDLPKFLDARGNLSFLQNNCQIPFEIKRVHWIYDVPGGETRGGVAYENSEEFIVAMSGSFDVFVDDGNGKQTYTLNRSYKGLYIPKGVWRELVNYSSNSVALITASTYYNPKEGIRDYDEFVKQAKNGNLLKDDLEQNFSQPEIEINVNEKVSYSVYDCGIIELDKHHSDKKGNLSVVENGQTLPFDVKRIYYLYDVPGGEERGGHAHKNLKQLIIAASGSFTVTLDDGRLKRAFVLNRPYQGLLVTPGIWRDLTDFSSGSVCMVLASEVYDEEDYVRDYENFCAIRKEQ